jgi:ferredoxin/coenzyme F420-reducing hydrogenase delta subunit
LPEALRTGWRRVEHGVDAAFGVAHNPLRALGALAILMLVLIVASGIWLYAALDTSASGAWHSVEVLSREQRYSGGLLRSLHRYAADAFVLLMLLHLLREWLFGHAGGFRRYSWLTGVPLIALAYVCAIGGFWLHWDELGQYSAVATAEWLDRLPLFGPPLARNFARAGAVSDRLFSLLVFIHLGVPLLLVFGLWFHVQRIGRAVVLPSPRLAAGSVAMLLALAFARPVTSAAPADLARVPAALDLDWLLLFVHPLVDVTSAGAVWLMVGATFAALAAWPFVRGARAPVAVVDPAHCNGCRRCVDDCPYMALTMVPHPNRRIGRQLAQVDAGLCAGCGICVGACPSATPFRSGAALVSGIEMPDAPLAALRQRLHEALVGTTGRIVVFGCVRGTRLDMPDVAAFPLACAGMLPPAFVEYALRDGAAAVLVSACRGCEFRLGARWTAERLRGAREPHLRASVPRERVVLVDADAGEEDALKRAVATLRRAVSARPASRAPSDATEPGHG